MAEARRYVCQACGAQVEAWSDGNPYFIDERGEKKYAYHPYPEVEQCIGNDVPHLCLGCGASFMVDSLQSSSTCPECKSDETCATYELEGRRCPFCKLDTFREDPGGRAIS
jgi:DNA-directed RNA polymerase subunit RPC12/RpoP